MAANPTPRRWRRFIDHLLDLRHDRFDLLVIDTVMSFLPAGQNNPGPLRKALNELRRPASYWCIRRARPARDPAAAVP
jgi:hypothetical protein